MTTNRRQEILDKLTERITELGLDPISDEDRAFVLNGIESEVADYLEDMELRCGVKTSDLF